ncbi:MAG TPA: PDZ domain-containing protein, partial [Gemmatimonadales bacterium]|nr:PDZ domain-containing protein [Gemmatimonadales bacterium]
QKGDIILALGDQPVTGPPDLSRRVAGIPPGTKVEVTLLRDRARKAVPVELGRLPERRPPAPAPAR